MHVYRAHPDVTVLNDYLAVPGLGFLPVNAFVIHAARPVVVDTGLGLPDRDFVASLAEVIDPADVAWIWLTHPDRDHTGGLFALLEAAPRARVVTTFIGAGIMSTERPLPIDRTYLLNPGESLDRRRPAVDRVPPATVRQPGHRRRPRHQHRRLPQLRLLRRAAAHSRTRQRRGRRHRQPGRPASRATAVGQRRQPVGAQRGPEPVRGLVPASARLRSLMRAQHPPAAGYRRHRAAYSTPCAARRTANRSSAPTRSRWKRCCTNSNPFSGPSRSERT